MFWHLSSVANRWLQTRPEEGHQGWSASLDVCRPKIYREIWYEYEQMDLKFQKELHHDS